MAVPTIKVLSHDHTEQVLDADNFMGAELNRRFTSQTVTIENGENQSGEIDMRKYSMMIVHLGAAWTAADIGFQVATAPGGGFQALYDDLGNIVMIDGPAVSRNYQAPPEIGGCGVVKLWSQNGAGVSVNQGAARQITVSLKV